MTGPRRQNKRFSPSDRFPIPNGEPCGALHCGTAFGPPFLFGTNFTQHFFTGALGCAFLFFRFPAFVF